MTTAMEATLAKSRFSDRAKKVTALFVLMACATTAHAQGVAPTQTDLNILASQVAMTPEAQRVVRQRRETTVVYPFGLSGTPLTGASVVASQDAKNVSIAATFSTSLLSELVLRASAPLGDDEPR